MVGTSPPLCVRLLGELVVSSGDRQLPLPPSKKARALLCYLILTGREHRRDRLCALLWDVADDPRASLRWALSRIRPAVDEPGVTRIQGTRDTVSFDQQGAKVDLELVRRGFARDITSLQLAELVELEGLFQGELLEGLELPEFMDFQAWLLAEREEARGLHVRILEELGRRYDSSSDEALSNARKLLHIDPLNAPVRAQLIELMLARGREKEAQELHRAGKRLFQELGSPCPAVLLDALAAGRRALALKHAHSQSPPPLQPTSEPPSASESSTTQDLLPSPPSAELSGEGDLSPASVRRAPAMPIFGRDALLQKIETRLHAPSTVPMLLLGEPGVGKSRLLDEVESRCHRLGSLVLAARAHEAESGRPYGPWIDALRRVSTELSADNLVANLIQDLSGMTLRDSTRDALFAGVASLLQREARERKVSLLFDDVHWFDEASVGLLSYVLRTCKREQIELVMASRDGELVDNAPMHRLVSQLRRDRYVEEIPVDRLSASATAELVSHVLRQLDQAATVDPQLVFDQSSGNPLFALEIARSKKATSDSLRGVVAGRLDRLPAEALEVVRWASVLGGRIAQSQLEEQLDLSPSELVSSLESLERLAILLPTEDGYVFSHDIVRSVVYAEISSPRRRIMHQRIAQALAQKVETEPTLVDDLAHHAVLGGQGQLAAEACISSGRRCLKLFANRQAETLAKMGLHYAEALGEEQSVLLSIDLFEIAFAARAPEDPKAFEGKVKSLAERALDLGELGPSRRAFTLLAYLSWETGNWNAAESTSHTLEFVSRAQNDQERVTAMAEAARCLAILEKDLPDAEGLLMQADSLADRLGIDSSHLRDGQGLLRLHQGQLDEAAGLFARAVGSARREGARTLEFNARSHAVMLEVQREDYTAALRLATDLEQLAAKFRQGSELPFARALAHFCEYAQGQATSREPLTTLLDELRAVDAKYRLVFILGRLAEVERRRGQSEEARTHAKEALEMARLLDRKTEQALAHCTLAELLLAEKDPDAARAELVEIDALMPSASREARTRALSVRKACESTR